MTGKPWVQYDRRALDFGSNGLRSIDQEGTRRLSAIHQNIHDRVASGDLPFLNVHQDDGAWECVSVFSESARERFHDCVVLGIGGSSLGAQALVGALGGRGMRVHFPDNVDPTELASLLSRLDLKRTLFNCVSKSGSTIETVAQLLVVRERLKRDLGADWNQHLVVTTDPEHGFLRELADRDELVRFEISKGVGGRFSVFTPVGLLPAALAGVDLAQLRTGISDAVALLAGSHPDQNAALMLASDLHHLDTQEGRNILFVASYANALAPLGDWFQQLWAESLGKAGAGSTPVPVVGATCQHSQLQLWMEGPQNAVVGFVRVESFQSDLVIDAGDLAGNPLVDLLHGHSMGHLLRIEQQATEQALAQAERPAFAWRMASIGPQSVAFLMTHMMAATAYAGGLYQVNPFDQPGVEAGKVIAKELLK